MWCLHEIEALYHRAQIALLEHCNSRTKVAIGGHICLMLCKKNCQFMELNAFSASASKTASVLFVPNMSCIECIAALHPASFPPRSCKFPHAFVTSSFTILLATFPAILRSTSPTPIGHKPGFLSRGASLPAINF